MTKEELSASYLKYKDAAKELAKVGVDTIALTGSPLFQLKGFRSDIEMIKEVEKETGIPTLWLALRKANVKEPIQGYGRLMRM